MASRRSGRERRRPYSARLVDTREPRERFLIVCEGAKTEPNYFRAFRVPKQVTEVIGIGDNTVHIVEEAIRRKSINDFDQVWCVFDRDSFPAEHFNRALDLASANNIEVAYSNEAFELWYLLHFNYCDAAISRGDYTDILTRELGHKYEKNARSMYDELLSKQPAALRNADRLLNSYSPATPASDNPSTSVHKLVIELNRFIQ
jgi:hypothetical protein